MTTTSITNGSPNSQKTIVGTAISDRITITDNQIYINSLEGDDTISGAIYLEQITLKTGKGDDTVNFSSTISSSALAMGAGNDSIGLLDFSGSIYGGIGNDTISINRENTVRSTLIRGDSGNDNLLIGNIVNSIINVNADKDNVVIHGYLEDSAVYGGVQSDTIRVNNTINSLVRGDLDDDKITINGDLIGSVVNGNAGDDSLTVTSAVIESSTIYGGQGNDRFSIIGNAIYIDGGKGNDAINTNSNEEHTIYGGLGEDTIICDSSKKTQTSLREEPLVMIF